MKLLLAMCFLMLTALPSPGEEFLLEVSGHDVRVINNGAEFNCGSIIEGDLDLECGTVTLVEVEVLEEPQYCVCPFDLIFDFTLAPGEYTLQLWRLQWWQTEPELVWVTEFEILVSGFLTDVRVEQSGCGGWGPTSIPEIESETASWSRIRSLY